MSWQVIAIDRPVKYCLIQRRQEDRLVCTNSLCSFSPFVRYSYSSANLMVIDAQYTRNREVCSTAFLCDPPRSHLSSPAYLPRLPVQHVIIEPVAALCRLLQLAISRSLTLFPRSVSHSARRRSTKDRSIFVTRSSRHIHRERRLDRADYLKAGAHARPSGFRQLRPGERVRQGH